jgi:predicted MPP superfamily phosphohydrolase
MIDFGWRDVLKLAIYYGSYFYFLAAPLLVWISLKKSGFLRLACVAILVPLTLLAYGRFIEPRFLLTNEHEVTLDGCFDRAGEIRIAVFADTHIGIFGNVMPLTRVVRAVNVANPDVTLIAGDFTFLSDPSRLDAFFSPLSALKPPVFAVLGNHDIGYPGHDLSKELYALLPDYNVTMIDNRTVEFAGGDFDIDLVGLSDAYGRNQDFSLLEAPVLRPRIVLTHNPVTLQKLTPKMRGDLFIFGHTHGGQIRLPVITCLFVDVCGKEAYGLRRGHGTMIFTTSGTGMTDLPMRFRVPPRVDILNISYKACPAADNSGSAAFRQ